MKLILCCSSIGFVLILFVQLVANGIVTDRDEATDNRVVTIDHNSNSNIDSGNYYDADNTDSSWGYVPSGDSHGIRVSRRLESPPIGTNTNVKIFDEADPAELGATEEFCFYMHNNLREHYANSFYANETTIGKIRASFETIRKNNYTAKIKKIVNRSMQNCLTTNSTHKINIPELLTISNQCRNSYLPPDQLSRWTGVFKVWAATYVYNDAESVVEWAIWHLLLGVDTILIYDNDSTDNLSQALAPLIQAQRVRRIPWPGNGVRAQEKAFYHAAQTAKAESVAWVLAIDPDEYLVPFKDECITSLMFDYSFDSRIGGLAINWRYALPQSKLWNRAIVEDSKLNRKRTNAQRIQKVKRNKLRRSYKTIFEFNDFTTGIPNYHVKSIVRPEAVQNFTSMHYADYVDDKVGVSPDSRNVVQNYSSCPTEVSRVAIMHFHYQTFEFALKKTKRWQKGAPYWKCDYCYYRIFAKSSRWYIVLNQHLKWVQEKFESCGSTSGVNSHDRIMQPYMRKQAEKMHKILSYKHDRLF